MIRRILDFLFGEDDSDCLISKEGYEILSDPVKRKNLRFMIDNYHETGIWDFEILNRT